MYKFFSENSIDYDLIKSSYRRFLLRICNERVSACKFVEKYLSLDKLGLYKNNNIVNFFFNFNYEDYELTKSEINYLKSIGEKPNFWVGPIFSNEYVGQFRTQYINASFRRFLLRHCNSRISLYDLTCDIEGLSPNDLGLFKKNGLSLFFKENDYKDFPLTFSERKFINSKKKDVNLWDKPIFKDYDTINEERIERKNQRNKNRKEHTYMDNENNYSLNERSRNKSESSIGSEKECNWSYLYNSDENGNEDNLNNIAANNYEVEAEDDMNNKSASDWGVEAEDDFNKKSASDWGVEIEDGWGIEKKIEDNEIKKYRQSIKNQLENYIKDESAEKKILDNIFDNINIINTDKFKLTENINDLNEQEKRLNENLQNLKIKKEEISKSMNDFQKKEKIEILKIEDIEKKLLKISSFEIKETEFNKKYLNNTLIFDLYFNENEKPEWMKEKTKCIIDYKERFNNEILDYVEYITTNDKLMKNRNEIEKELQQIINDKFKNYKVLSFGSVPQGISTVYSDLDFEIITEQAEEKFEKVKKIEEIKTYEKDKQEKELEKFMKAQREKEIKKLEEIENIIKPYFLTNLIRSAKVPIIQAFDKKKNIRFDISIDRENGPKNTEIIKNIVSKYTILRHAIIILKIFLKINGLNSAFNGGMSSFLLFHLAYFILVYKIKIQNYKETNIINFLIKFFEFFSDFDYGKYSLYVSEKECSVNERKNEQDKTDKIKHKNDISVINNLTENNIEFEFKDEKIIKVTKNNIGEKCFKYYNIQCAFSVAFQTIKNNMNYENFSILNKIFKKKLVHFTNQIH